MTTLSEHRVERKKCDICGVEHSDSMLFNQGSSAAFDRFPWKVISVQNPTRTPYLGRVDCCSKECMRRWINEMMDLEALETLSVTYQEKP